MEKGSRIFIAGHRGLVGSAIVRKLEKEGYNNLILKTHGELDLIDQHAVLKFFKEEKPEYVFLAAAHVGGIVANMKHQADFLYDNLMIQNNVIWGAHKNDVKKLLFLGSSCIYPRDCSQPIKEEYLLDGKLESTNEGYAIAKIAGMKLCEKIYEQYGKHFISCMPTNLYGVNDNFHSEYSHVIPGLIRKIYTAKEQNIPQLELWGTGMAKREFLYVDDLADAVYFLMNNYEDKEFINIGTGEEITIKELVHLIAELIGYKGELVFDKKHPDGNLRKLLDLNKIHGLGWKHKISLREGLIKAIEYYITHVINNEMGQIKNNIDKGQFGIVIPLANEEDIIDELIMRVLKHAPQNTKVFCVIDKVSKDGTRAKIQEWQNGDSRISLVWAPENRCVVDAYFRGYREALNYGCDWILEMDGGLSHNPEEIPLFINAMEEGFDFAGGSRFMKEGRYIDPGVRYMISLFGTLLTNILVGTKMKDMTSGFECFSRKALERVLNEGVKSRAHFFQTEIRTMMHDFNWIEIPITYKNPSSKVGSTNIKEAFKNLWALRKKRKKFLN